MNKLGILSLAVVTVALASTGYAQQPGSEDRGPERRPPPRKEHHAGSKADLSKLPPAATKATVTYDADIKPIFEASCVKCHGDERPKAGLKLTSLEGALKGTKEGKVIQPGDSTKSDLLIAVARISEDDEEWMPPPNNRAKIEPLTKEQVGLIRAWIEQGAK